MSRATSALAIIAEVIHSESALDQIAYGLLRDVGTTDRYAKAFLKAAKSGEPGFDWPATP